MDLLHLSQTLKSARAKQKLTIAQLAAKTGLSKGFISRLENFRVTPSLNALGKIVSALGMSMSGLFQPGNQSPEYVFGNIGQGEQIVRDESDRFGLKYFSLAYNKLDRGLDPFIVEYRPCREHRGFLMHQSEEFFILLAGSVDFFVFDETNCKTLTQGDTVYLSKNIPHAVRLRRPNKRAKAMVIYREEGEE